ncbi:hypothetical protein BDK51DRAFT_38105 [Blyttiomyces helicus]|uniref:Uncharacterized protein n=1 Tax=Blyttiomyces helicus TaxID=388810 RepID=A0A4P9WIE3_9FUNG|nr:hypothetical protein BDK51DRAFT_38105 [Blyttiomyces helicus]|eukprot:RKO92631.1 hypothetical protein BDK51DRAFT_38105 [Blyttiomyces helicus]
MGILAAHVASPSRRKLMRFLDVIADDAIDVFGGPAERVGVLIPEAGLDHVVLLKDVLQEEHEDRVLPEMCVMPIHQHRCPACDGFLSDHHLLQTTGNARVVEMDVLDRGLELCVLNDVKRGAGLIAEVTNLDCCGMGHRVSDAHGQQKLLEWLMCYYIFKDCLPVPFVAHIVEDVVKEPRYGERRAPILARLTVERSIF